MAVEPGAPRLSLAIQIAVAADLPGRADFRRWARAALAGDLAATLRIVDEDEGRQLNRDYRGKDYATNVLSFEYGPDPDIGVPSGDIVLCAPVVEREAAAQGIALNAHYAHLTVHGLLHVQGWDHERGAADAQAMEAVEGFIMRRLGFADPYANERRQ
jgi:probable rRNA maturation factor